MVKNKDFPSPASLSPLGSQDLVLSQTVEGTSRQYVTLHVEQDIYGVDILDIQEIKAWSETTQIPNSPDFMRGVLNLRGMIVPIYDLKARFGNGLTTTSPMHVIIIIKNKTRLAGILVDAVSDIIHLSESDIKSFPELEKDPQQAFLAGIAQVSNQMIALLDIEKLFAKTPEALSQSEERTKQIAPDHLSEGEET